MKVFCPTLLTLANLFFSPSALASSEKSQEAFFIETTTQTDKKETQKDKDKEKELALELGQALKTGDLEKTRELLFHKGANPNFFDQNFTAPIFFHYFEALAKRTSDDKKKKDLNDILKILLLYPINLSLESEDGYSFLYMLFNAGRWEPCEIYFTTIRRNLEDPIEGMHPLFYFLEKTESPMKEKALTFFLSRGLSILSENSEGVTFQEEVCSSHAKGECTDILTLPAFLAAVNFSLPAKGDREETTRLLLR